MTSLNILKQILPLSEDDIEKQTHKPEDELNLENLQKYTSTSSSTAATSLEQIRSLCSSSLLSETTNDQLYTLIEQFENYKSEIRSHRSKLGPIRTVINSFNNDLKSLSSSLIDSREKSVQLSKNLARQNSLTEKLNPIIIDLMIPPDIVKSIVKAPINANWLENLRFINEKLQLIESIKNNVTPETTQYNGSVAFSELTECVNSLKDKAVERIRDFIIIKIKLLRTTSSSAGVQSSQNIQKELLIVKEIFPFIMEQHPDLAKQLRLAYTYTMKWYYETKFAKYAYALQKLKLRHVDTTLLLGSTTSAEDKSTGYLSGWFGSSAAASTSSSATSSQSNSPIPQTHKIIISEYLPSIEKRIQILHTQVEEEEQPEEAIPSQIAETTPFAYWIEFVYKQWSIALIDNLIVEYLFMVEFFYLGDEKFDEIDVNAIEAKHTASSDETTTTPRTTSASSTKVYWHSIMFSNVFKYGNEFVAWLISHQPSAFSARNPNANTRLISSAANVASTGTTATFGTCDGYAILLMIRMIQIAQSSLHNEFHIPIADEYLNSLLLLLWPHFTKIIDLNCDSIKKSVIHSTSKFGSSGANLAPVGVTQQFAQYLSGLLKLAESNYSNSNEGGVSIGEAFHGEPLYTSVRRLRNDFESVLTKLSGTMFSKSRKIEKELFLYNNYFLVVSILKNENLDNDLFAEQIKHFEMLCEAYKK